MADETSERLSLAQLPQDEKDKRRSSFGSAAAHYERYRPGPPIEAVDWVLPGHVARVVDLGAGTGALSRLLIGKADEVIAVEPDERMRAVLTEVVPGAQAVDGRGEAMPLPDGSVDAVMASSSWHWMEPTTALAEVRRVLVPGGVLGAIWVGPDLDSDFVKSAQELLSQRTHGPGQTGVPDEQQELAGMIMGDATRPVSRLEIPEDAGYETPELKIIKWDIALNADEMIGLLGTLSWFLTMPDEQRSRVLGEARQLLRDVMGVEGVVTVEIGYRCDVWRARRRA
jgi:SAM-dependent methyltransferase